MQMHVMEDAHGPEPLAPPEAIEVAAEEDEGLGDLAHDEDGPQDLAPPNGLAVGMADLGEV